MIVLSARCLSRAWLAVQYAAGNDESRPVLHRSVRVEAFDDLGVRLIATDSYWLAHCWVPAYTALTDSEGAPGADTEEASLFEHPDRVVTVLDHEYRVRDLMQFLVRATNPRESLDEPVELDLAATLAHDLTPTLFPDLVDTAARFELASRERVVVATTDDYPDWRLMLSRTHGLTTAQSQTGISPEVLGKLAKVASTVAAGGIDFRWHDLVAAWSLRPPAARLHHRPAGLVALQRLRPDTENTTGAEDSGDGVQ